MRLRQILLNVVGNALKFTVRGGVSVVVKIAASVEGAAKSLLFIVLKDTGRSAVPST